MRVSDHTDTCEARIRAGDQEERTHARAGPHAYQIHSPRSHRDTCETEALIAQFLRSTHTTRQNVRSGRALPSDNPKVQQRDASCNPLVDETRSPTNTCPNIVSCLATVDRQYPHQSTIDTSTRISSSCNIVHFTLVDAQLGSTTFFIDVVGCWLLLLVVVVCGCGVVVVRTWVVNGRSLSITVAGCTELRSLQPRKSCPTSTLTSQRGVKAQPMRCNHICQVANAQHGREQMHACQKRENFLNCGSDMD